MHHPEPRMQRQQVDHCRLWPQGLEAATKGLSQEDEDLLRAAHEWAEVNPMLAAHGGFVTFAGHDTEGTAYFTMGGGCHGCSMSRQTMLEGVQSMVSAKVPTITKVRDLTDHSTGENPFFK